MRLHDPFCLLLLLVWIPMVWVYLYREKKARPSVRFSDLSIIKKLPPSPFLRFRHALLVLRLIGVGLLVVALSRPQHGQTEEEVSTEGVDIMLVLDISYSMRALDFKPDNRLAVAKAVIKDFIAKRQHDRIGLVIFAKRSFTKCPLTLDYAVLDQFLEDANFTEFSDATAIGTALATAANRLKDSPAKSKVIVLLTDGANNAGDIDPVTAARAAKEFGVKIYTIGIGREGEVPIPVDVQNPFTGKIVGQQIQMMKSDIDEQVLADIAGATDGKFFRAKDPEKLKEIYDTIDKLEKTEIKTKSYTTYADRFFPWLVWGFALIMLELFLANTRLRRIP